MTKATDPHLSPCPFCRTHCAEISHGETRTWVFCNNCGATGPNGETSRDAAAYWNAAYHIINVLYVNLHNAWDRMCDSASTFEHDLPEIRHILDKYRPPR